jgi:hypothetical protein
MSAPARTGVGVDLARLVATGSRFVTTEYASLTRGGAPITWPVTPYRGVDGTTIDVTTGLSYPLKAERARRDPRVGLSFTHPTGSGLERPASFVVLGQATVRDADLVATSSRYLREAQARFPEQYRSTPKAVLRLMAFYWTRMWIEVTPIRALWWEDGDLGRPPIEWQAPAGTAAPPSDPAPTGPSSGSWTPGPGPDWRQRAAGALDRLGLPVVTLLAADGTPLPLPVRGAEATRDGYEVEVPVGVELRDGPAFVSFHQHGPAMEHQENVGLAGTATVAGTAVRIRVDRALHDWTLSGRRGGAALAMLRARRRMAPKLEAEAARRGQPVPRFRDLRLRDLRLRDGRLRDL